MDSLCLRTLSERGLWEVARGRTEAAAPSRLFPSKAARYPRTASKMDSPTPAQSTWAQARGGASLRTWCASGREVARGRKRGLASLAAPAAQPTKHGPRLR